MKQCSIAAVNRCGTQKQSALPQPKASSISTAAAPKGKFEINGHEYGG
jgi:hypothetical protein